MVSSRDTVRKATETQVFNNEVWLYPEGSRNLVNGLKYSFVHSTNKYWIVTMCSSLFLVMTPAARKIEFLLKWTFLGARGQVMPLTLR